MKIKQLIFSIILFILFVISLIFYFFYKEQQQKLFEVLSDNIKKSLISTSYISTKILNQQQNRENVIIIKTLLDRKVAESEYIRGFIVEKDKKPLYVSGDVHLKIPLNAKTSLKDIKLNDLLDNKAFEKNLVFYINGKKVVYKLYMFLDKDKIKNLFFMLKVKYIAIFYGLIFILFFFLNYVINRVLVIPLVKLQKFAEQKEHKPEKFFIVELDSIKESLANSFEKLDNIIANLYETTITDSLTRVGNRKLLKKHVKELISKNKKFAMVFLDLDNFKEINDFFGHSVGDEIIIKVTDILKKIIKKPNIITRLGGDEFILIIETSKELNNLELFLQKIVDEIHQKWVIREEEIYLSASMGIVVYPTDDNSFYELLKKADIAMYEAKKLGKNKYIIFTKDVQEKIDFEFKLKNKLKKALENNEFELYLQPQFSEDEKIIGVEALIRWNSDEGIIFPSVFIPIAEKTGLIYEIGKWVIQESVNILNYWQKKDEMKHFSLSFNVSVVQLRHEKFLCDFKEIVKELKIDDKAKLEVEITESVFIEDKHRAKYLLAKIREMGFKINLDDFGTGYSSLSVLKEFKMDILKIDKSFVDEVLNKDGEIYVKTIIDMAKNLNLKTVAEGMETREQFEKLRELGVDYYQGYYFAKPMRLEEFEKFVKNRTI